MRLLRISLLMAIVVLALNVPATFAGLGAKTGGMLIHKASGGTHLDLCDYQYICANGSSGDCCTGLGDCCNTCNVACGGVCGGLCITD